MPPVKTDNAVVIEAPKVTVHFERKVWVRDYESALASIWVDAPTAPLTGDSVVDGEMILEAVTYAFFQCKTAVFTQLGIEFEITPENVVLERIEKVLPIAEVMTTTIAPSKSNGSGKTDDRDAAVADLISNPKGWFDNRKGFEGKGKSNPKAPDFKVKKTNRNIAEGTGIWLDSLPEGFDADTLQFV